MGRRRILLVLLLGGIGLAWVLLAAALWVSSPVGDVDREPARRLFAASAVIWLLITAPLLYWATRLTRP
jgi:hypothetical protein